MKKNGTYKPTGVVAQLWGGPTDANASWFKSGNDDILNPLFRTKKLKKGPAKFVPGWLADKAQVLFEQMLVQTNNNIQGVVAANDNIAGAVIATLKAKGLDPIPLSGQDNTAAAVQQILAGWQTMTVYKYVPDEANAAAAAAIALYQGKKPERRTRKTQGEAGVRHPGDLDHQGELHAPLQGRRPEAERGLHRGVQEVLQVAYESTRRVEAPFARLHSYVLGTFQP